MEDKKSCLSCSVTMAAVVAAKSLQSCLTLCDPTDGSPPSSAVPGILQVRTLQWVAISFSNAWKRKVKVKSFSCVRLCATPWAEAYQAPPSMGFARQEYWSGPPLPSPVTMASLHISALSLFSLISVSNCAYFFLVRPCHIYPTATKIC